MIIIHVERDGNMWMATYSTFKDAMESPISYAETPTAAIQKLMEETAPLDHEQSSPDSTFGVPGIPVAEAPTPKVPKAFASTQQQ